MRDSRVPSPSVPREAGFRCHLGCLVPFPDLSFLGLGWSGPEDYLVADHGMDRADAYVLASLAGDLKISELVDMPHYLVSMHMPKEVLGVGR